MVDYQLGHEAHIGSEVNLLSPYLPVFQAYFFQLVYKLDNLLR